MAHAATLCSDHSVEGTVSTIRKRARINMLEHVLIGKVRTLCRNMLSDCRMTDFNHSPVSRSLTRDHVSPVDHSLLCAAGGREVTAWDLPTRLFKWSLVALIIIAWITSGFSDPNMAVHKAAGYGILTLIVYRFLWGFFGGNTAR